MAKRNLLERTLILWLLSYGVFVFWSIYVVVSQERSISASNQVSIFESQYPAPTNRNKMSQSQ